MSAELAQLLCSSGDWLVVANEYIAELEEQRVMDDALQHCSRTEQCHGSRDGSRILDAAVLDAWRITWCHKHHD